MAPTKKVDLERVLASLDAVPRPREAIEQYATPPGIAADVGYIALAKGDLADGKVLDLGCGNGILAIAAALLGAAPVLGIDVDPAAVEVARRNARAAGVDVSWRVADVGSVREAVRTVLMNPPFGSQRKHADLPFLDAAIALGQVVYTFHNAATERFIDRRIRSLGGRVTDRLDYAFPIPRMFAFHREDRRDVPVVLFRVVAAKG